MLYKTTESFFFQTSFLFSSYTALFQKIAFLPKKTETPDGVTFSEFEIKKKLCDFVDHKNPLHLI